MCNWLISRLRIPPAVTEICDKAFASDAVTGLEALSSKLTPSKTPPRLAIEIACRNDGLSIMLIPVMLIPSMPINITASAAVEDSPSAMVFPENTTPASCKAIAWFTVKVSPVRLSLPAILKPEILDNVMASATLAIWSSAKSVSLKSIPRL